MQECFCFKLSVPVFEPEPSERLLLKGFSAKSQGLLPVRWPQLEKKHNILGKRVSECGRSDTTHIWFLFFQTKCSFLSIWRESEREKKRENVKELDHRLSAGRPFLISADGTALKIHPLPENLTAHPAWPQGPAAGAARPRRQGTRGPRTRRHEERERSCVSITPRNCAKPKHGKKNWGWKQLNMAGRF